MANASGAKVISLESHPLWAAAQRRERQLMEEMRRHPAFIGRQRAAALAADVAVSVPELRLCHSADTPA